jgi:hypothetical protein
VPEPPADVPAGGPPVKAADQAGIDEILAPSAPPATRSGVPDTARPETELPAGSPHERLVSTWRTEDLDILDDAEDLDESADAAPGAAEEAGVSGNLPRHDTGSAVDDGRLAEDKKIRDLGWAQYGERLRKARKKPGSEGDDEVSS